MVVYDVVVIGAGHAGCEAALACARMGCSVLLLAIDLDKIAVMPCSPSIGGMAKGQLVKEIDALGGAMGRAADLTAIQYRLLNTRKGPAVQATRTQNDKNRYHAVMKSVVERQAGLELKQALVEELVIEGNQVVGVVDHTGFQYPAKTVVLAAGTFLSGLVHIGMRTIQAGRAGEFASYQLADQLKSLGFESGRMKTGTPPRLKKNSIDFSVFKEQAPDCGIDPFSGAHRSELPQLSSFMGTTTADTRRIVLENLKYSALYGGAIKGVSARYCPSLEDKIVKFSHRETQRVILEPEGVDTDEIYASGLGNSLPLEIQIQIVRSVKGLEQAEIMRPAYAIEYDYFNPTQLKPSLESKRIAGLFLAGQLNGTSGYEEAAAQGLWAGINAACRVQGRKPFLLDRSQAYMAVLVDDLITRGTREPYRMFTSRAEYRLILREDNADLRMAEIAKELGLIDQTAYQAIMEKQRCIDAEIQRLKNTIARPNDKTNAFLLKHGTQPINTGTPLDQLLKRNEVNYRMITALEKIYRTADLPNQAAHLLIDDKMAKQVEIEIKYEGYIQRQLREIEAYRRREKLRIPDNFAFYEVHGLSNELKEKLSVIKPLTVGQASRIDGMTPSAISAILIALKYVSQVGD